MEAWAFFGDYTSFCLTIENIAICALATRFTMMIDMLRVFFLEMHVIASELGRSFAGGKFFVFFAFSADITLVICADPLALVTFADVTVFGSGFTSEVFNFVVETRALSSWYAFTFVI